MNTHSIIDQLDAAHKIRPAALEMSDIKWKYLVRSTLRSKNILLTGPAGTGKTQAAYSLKTATNRPFFYFNFGASSDPRSMLIGNAHFTNNQTVFKQSVFIQAIQTENAIILLDELSRAHPDAWNILMTVLDEEQRYLRIDEDINTPTIKVANGVSFIATANIGSEYTSTRVLDRALLDRFEIIEVDILTKESEIQLLTFRFPSLDQSVIDAIADIAHVSRQEWRSEDGKLSTMISTRMTLRMCELIQDGFTLQEAADIGIVPYFDATGGSDSERTFIKQLIQKHMPSTLKNIFEL